MNGCVTGIFISPAKKNPMHEVKRVWAITRVGLEGDRYAAGQGSFSGSTRVTVRHVSLVSAEAIEESNRTLARPFSAAETRRNILTTGVDLNSLVGKRFRVGEVFMRGVELCAPCDRPSELAGKPGFRAAFENRGGLRAEIQRGGYIRVGDEIVVL